MCYATDLTSCKNILGIFWADPVEEEIVEEVLNDSAGLLDDFLIVHAKTIGGVPGEETLDNALKVNNPTLWLGRIIVSKITVSKGSNSLRQGVCFITHLIFLLPERI